jgi:hypothetical protein
MPPLAAARVTPPVSPAEHRAAVRPGSVARPAVAMGMQVQGHQISREYDSPAQSGVQGPGEICDNNGNREET